MIPGVFDVPHQCSQEQSCKIPLSVLFLKGSPTLTRALSSFFFVFPIFSFYSLIVFFLEFHLLISHPEDFHFWTLNYASSVWRFAICLSICSNLGPNCEDRLLNNVTFKLILVTARIYEIYAVHYSVGQQPEAKYIKGRHRKM